MRAGRKIKTHTASYDATLKTPGLMRMSDGRWRVLFPDGNEKRFTQPEERLVQELHKISLDRRYDLIDGLREYEQINAALLPLPKGVKPPAGEKQDQLVARQEAIAARSPLVKNYVYANDDYCMENLPGVRLIHGYVTSDTSGTSGVLIEHAWNEYKRHHFDVTSEPYRLGLHGHLQIIILTEMEACRLMVECGAHAHYVVPYFNRQAAEKG